MPRNASPVASVTRSMGRTRNVVPPRQTMTTTSAAIIARLVASVRPIVQTAGSPPASGGVRRRSERTGLAGALVASLRGWLASTAIVGSLQGGVAAPEVLADELGGGVDDESHREEGEAAEEEHAVVRAPAGDLGHLGRDVRRQGPEPLEDVPVEGRRAAGGHEDDHGLPDRPPEADHAGREDARAG